MAQYTNIASAVLSLKLDIKILFILPLTVPPLVIKVVVAGEVVIVLYIAIIIIINPYHSIL